MRTSIQVKNGIVEQVPGYDDSSETLVNAIFVMTSVGGVHVASWVCYRGNTYGHQSLALISGDTPVIPKG